METNKYGNKFWALYDGEELICVTVYKKGAEEVKRRLEEVRKARDEEVLEPREVRDSGSRRCRVTKLGWESYSEGGEKI